jgi:hypothetical protein
MPVYQVNLHAEKETIYVRAPVGTDLHPYIEEEYGYKSEKFYDVNFITESDHPHLEVTTYGVLEKTPDDDLIIHRIEEVEAMNKFVKEK